MEIWLLNIGKMEPFSILPMVQIMPGPIPSLFQEADVYAAGAEFKDGNFFVAKYWLNGKAMAITDSSNYSMASAIAVEAHDIYLAGKELQGPLCRANRWPYTGKTEAKSLYRILPIPVDGQIPFSFMKITVREMKRTVMASTITVMDRSTLAQ